MTIEQRVLVYYCATVIRELDLAAGKSVLVRNWITTRSSGGKD